MTNKNYFFYIVLTIPCDMIKKFILKTFIVRKIHYERKLALFLKKSDICAKTSEIRFSEKLTAVFCMSTTGSNPSCFVSEQLTSNKIIDKWVKQKPT